MRLSQSQSYVLKVPSIPLKYLYTKTTIEPFSRNFAVKMNFYVLWFYLECVGVQAVYKIKYFNASLNHPPFLSSPDTIQLDCEFSQNASLEVTR